MKRHASGKVFFRFAFSLAIVVLAGSCAKPTVVRRGVEMPVEKARLLDFSDAEQALTSGQFERALSLYSAFVKNYPGSHLIDDAYYRIGQIHMRHGRYPEAILAYQHIIQDHYDGDLLNITRFQIGYCYQKLGKILEATDFFLSADLSKLSVDVQHYVMKSLHENILRIHDPEKRLLMLDQILSTITAAEKLPAEKLRGQETPPIKSALLEQELRHLINTDFTMEALLKVTDRVKSSYADTLIRLKIGLNYSHQKNRSQAEEILRPLIERLQTDPDSIPPYARTLLGRIQRRFHPDPYAIGILLPLRGPAGQLGQSLLNGILFSLHYLTPRSKEAVVLSAESPPFVLHIRDTAATSPSLNEMVDSLIYDDKVSLIIGPLLAEQTALVARKTKSLGIPIITFCPKEGISELGEYVFQDALTARLEVTEILTFLTNTLKAQNVALLFPNNNYGHQFTKHFWKEAKKRGVSISAVEMYEKETKDFVLPLKKMVGLYYLEDRRQEICPKASYPTRNKPPPPVTPQPPCYPEDQLPPLIDFDVLVVPDSYEAVSLILPHLAYLNMNGVQLIGTSAFDAEKVIQRAGASASGAIFLDTFSRFSNRYYVKDFYRAYFSRFNEPPDRFVADGFDTMEILKYLYQKHSIRERTDIVKGLKSIAHFPGVTGNISIESDGTWKKEASFFIIDNMSVRPIEPSE